MNELQENVRIANGLMPPEVYEALYEAALERRPLRGVEVGTAHGASAIALTMGALAAQPTFRLTTIDRLESDRQRGEPSSRSKFGSAEENRRIVEKNLKRAGLEHAIDLYVGTSITFAGEGKTPAEIDVLLLDADGRIDRDLALFSDALVEGALVVIDDIDGLPKVTVGEGDSRWIDLKHVISASLLEAYCKAGLLKETQRVASTAFCTLCNKERWTHEALAMISLEQYRNLVFTSVDRARIIAWALNEPDHFEEAVTGRRMLGMFGGLIRALKAMKRFVLRGDTSRSTYRT